MKALVLSGGGALGAYEAGAISVLCRRIEFDLVCGTSIGALNASFVAQNRLDDLEQVWKTIGSRKIITLAPTAQALSDFAMGVIGFQKTNVLMRLLAVPGLVAAFRKIGPLDAVMNLLGGLAPQPIADILRLNVDFARLAKPLIVSATNLTTGNSDAFYFFPNTAAGDAFAAAHDKGASHPLTPDNIRDAIRSSAAIPFAFAPVQVAVNDGTPLFVDGGVANNTPLGVAIDAGATDITVIFLNPPDLHEPQKIGNLAQIGLSCFGIMQERILELDFKSAQRVNAAAEKGAGGAGSSGDRRSIILRPPIRPAKTLPITVLQFDRQDLIDEAYELGVADATAALP